jgi:Xaa-Pro aminopeptidase
MFSASTYLARRARLMSQLGSGIVLLPGNNESSMNYPSNPYRFRQDSTFLYFLGIDKPGLFGIIDIDHGQTILFGDDEDLDDIIWTGKQPSTTELARQSSIEIVYSLKEVESFIRKAKESKQPIHFPPQYRTDNALWLGDLLGIPPRQINNNASLSLIKACVSLRSVKDDFEISEIEKAGEVGYQMHMLAMKNATEGKSEAELAGALEGIAHSFGGTISFPIILSQHGETLHNYLHDAQLQNGKLLLVDAGAESALHYASDFTRTTPVGHVFTQQQKGIYEIVLNANNTATAISKPGKRYMDVHLFAAKIIATGLKELGLMQGDTDEAVAQGAHALFFPHGLGHMMGLDVHDMESYGQIYVGYDEETRPSSQFGTASLRFGRRLQEGFVLTVEPGIYFIPELIERWSAQKMHSSFINYTEVKKYIGFGGIRIEDNILITKDRAKIIGHRLPATVAEIEAL